MAFDLGFVVVIVRSDIATGVRGRKTYVILGCERGGKYRKYKADAVASVYGTRKCECPFRLKGKSCSDGAGWVLKVMCGHHNHELAETLVGYPYAGRLNTSEKSLLVDMTKSKVTPANILLTLKQNNDRNVTTIKQIYNARHAYKRSLRGSRTELQQLMMLLDRDKYIHWSRCADDSKVVTDLYRLPLLEIVGMTSTGLTFSAAFAFLSTERQSNFTWALEKLKGLFLTSEGGPKVIVTDRDLALMNAISSVFPESYKMLCRFHILKNVKAKCKMLVHSTEVWEVLMDAWENVMDCAYESLFAEYVNGFEYASRSWPLFFEYVNQNWIIPYSTYFVKFWTNKVMHLGNTTTNRTESAHWSLKKVLGNSMGDLCSCWDSIHNVIILQHNKIKASFESSVLLRSDYFKGYIYRELIGRVSRYALDLIAKELKIVQQIGLDSSKCGCVLRRTFGVPCACELARYDPRMIPIGEFHIMWRRLHFSNVELNETKPQLSIKDELKQVEERFNEVNIGGKVTIKQKLLEIVCPTLTSMVPPLHKVKTKGANKRKVKRSERSTTRDPSYFEYVDAFHSTIESSSVRSKLQSKPKAINKRRVPMIDQFHSTTHPFIVDVDDVVADGHCGYRCIAALLGLGEDSWPVVRNELYKELSSWRDEYASLVGGYDRLEELRTSLLANKSKWMTLPDIGYAIANRYNVILVCLSYSQSYTIFPLRSTPPSDITQHRLICIGHVHGCHFVQVKLQEGCSLPTVNIMSSTHCYPEARAWSSIYTSRMHAFEQLMDITTSYVDLGDS
ncbi:PKS-NRPS hybrid synthetase cheA-like [Vigna angularis]|uniref:PKS-NRPS hybrid synthetase cheA-like n=1 Tax=Phaseolus angularis TaxID=3914 RepID=UPI0022B3606C|nr:PKS-NRPS hybrid synthetase cheA-like [Vigna angularis]